MGISLQEAKRELVLSEFPGQSLFPPILRERFLDEIKTSYVLLQEARNNFVEHMDNTAFPEEIESLKFDAAFALARAVGRALGIDDIFKNLVLKARIEKNGIKLEEVPEIVYEEGVRISRNTPAGQVGFLGYGLFSDNNAIELQTMIDYPADNHQQEVGEECRKSGKGFDEHGYPITEEIVSIDRFVRCSALARKTAQMYGLEISPAEVESIIEQAGKEYHLIPIRTYFALLEQAAGS